MVAAFQLRVMQDREVGNDTRRNAAVLDEDQRGLVLGIRDKTPDQRRKRPLGTMPKTAAGRTPDAARRGRPARASTTRIRAVSLDRQAADDAMGTDREFFRQRPAFQRNGPHLASARPLLRRPRSPTRGCRLGHGRWWPLRPTCRRLAQIALLQRAIVHRGFDGEFFAPQHDRRPRLGLGRGEQIARLGEDRKGSQQDGKRSASTMVCHGSENCISFRAACNCIDAILWQSRCGRPGNLRR